MPEKAIIAIEEALLASLFTQRATVELLIKKGILTRDELEQEILKSESESVGAGSRHKHMYFEKRHKEDRRTDPKQRPKTEKRHSKRRH